MGAGHVVLPIQVRKQHLLINQVPDMGCSGSWGVVGSRAGASARLIELKHGP